MAGLHSLAPRVRFDWEPRTNFGLLRLTSLPK